MSDFSASEVIICMLIIVPFLIGLYVSHKKAGKSMFEIGQKAMTGLRNQIAANPEAEDIKNTLSILKFALPQFIISGLLVCLWGVFQEKGDNKISIIDGLGVIASLSLMLSGVASWLYGCFLASKICKGEFKIPLQFGLAAFTAVVAGYSFYQSAGGVLMESAIRESASKIGLLILDLLFFFVSYLASQKLMNKDYPVRGLLIGVLAAYIVAIIFSMPEGSTLPREIKFNHYLGAYITSLTIIQIGLITGWRRKFAV